MKKLVFVTGNDAKALEISTYLHRPLDHQKIDLVEVQSLDLDEVVRHKAAEAYHQIGRTSLVEDTALTFHALGKLPGPLIKWFLKELDNAGLCKLLHGYDDRTATASVAFGLADGIKVRIFRADVSGTIADSPRGDSNFGWDPIFIPTGQAKTWGEMTLTEKSQTSMRKLACIKLQSYLGETG
ncbi:non-canonical purine NTP pyrophosphatase [Candidatus Microgenomates bacterium]|nr:non-canonical purine NTP pyrophosphatase [Candidatus Microgenomates bacterium]